MSEVQKVQKKLFLMQDIGYKEFQAKLMPTVDKATIIGVRTPNLRKYAKEFFKEDYKSFLKSLPHKYYEENNLHGFLIEQIKDFDECIVALDEFLPYVNNWATCDSITPKILGKHPDRLILKIDEWLFSSHSYTVRYGIKILMSFYLEENFKEEYLSKVSLVKSDEYYVKMMVAWYFATALYKKYDKAVLYLENKKIDMWVHNKTIQKACESYRIDEKKKEYLKTLKR